MSVSRMLYLLKRDYILYRKSMFFVCLALFLLNGVIMFITTEEYCNGSLFDITDIIGITIIFGSWFLISASAFHEFRRNGTRNSYLLLPTTTLEKWLVRWFETFVLFFILSLALTILSYITFSYWIHSIWPKCGYVPWTNLLDIDFPNTLAILIHSLLFLFGIVFNRFGVAKAIFATCITFFLGYLSVGLIDSFLNGFRSTYEMPINWDTFPNFVFVVVPLILLASFYKLKEKEA